MDKKRRKKVIRDNPDDNQIKQLIIYEKMFKKAMPFNLDDEKNECIKRGQQKKKRKAR